MNTSYVLTCSNDFRDTLENIVKSLNCAGFSRKDYRVAGEAELPVIEPQEIPQSNPMEPIASESSPLDIDSFAEVDTSAIQIPPVSSTSAAPVTGTLSTLLSIAEKQAEQYEQESRQNDISGFIGGDIGDMIKQYRIQPQYAEEIKSLRIPQFVIESPQDLFSEGTELLEKDALLDKFTLSGQDATVNFSLSAGEVYTVDIHEQGDAVPKYKRASQLQSEYLRDVLARMAPEEKIESCTKNICHIINRNNAFATSEVEDYVRRVVANMTEDELAVIETSVQTYALKIKDKIEALQNAYREKKFYKWLDSEKITCQEMYVFPDIITPQDASDSVPLSL